MMMRAYGFSGAQSLLMTLFFYGEYAMAERFKKAIQADEFKVTPSILNAEASLRTSTLVVGCVDFRFVDELNQLMREVLYLKDDYDQINVPGASLFFVENGYPHWNQTLEEIIALLKKLHGIQRVIFVDHIGCGAYKIIKGDARVATAELEEMEHREVFSQAREKMKNLFPELEVYTLLLDFSGHVKNIKP